MRILIKNKKTLLIIIIVAIIIIISVIVSIILLRNKDKTEIIEEQSIDEGKMERQFDTMFNNKENDYVKTRFNIMDEDPGKFLINAHIPEVTLENEYAKQINNEIQEIFINKLIEILEQSETYTIYNLDYCTEVNNDILSLAVKCVLKDGANPQRTIIKTYNYNLEKGKLIEITDLVPEEKKEEIQSKINKRIEKEIKKEETIIEQGYNVYRRNSESEVYKLENSTEFYMTEGNIIYIIYCYGNNNYTNEMDLIITKI